MRRPMLDSPGRTSSPSSQSSASTRALVSVNEETRHARRILVLALVLITLQFWAGGMSAEAMPMTEQGSTGGCIEAWAQDQPCFGGSWGGGGGEEAAPGEEFHPRFRFPCLDIDACERAPEECPPRLKTCRALPDPDTF